MRPRDKAALDLIEGSMEQAHRVREPLEPQWQENWNNYRVESTFGQDIGSKQYPLGTGSYNRFQLSPINFLKTPESHQGTNTLRALYLASLFGVRNYIQAEPTGDEDVEKARRVSKLLMYGTERPGNFRTNYEVLGDSLIFGLGSYSGIWKTVNKVVPRRMPVPDPTGMSPDGILRNPQTGSPMTVLQNVYMPVFDDVSLETDSLWDTWFDPGATRFHDVQFKVTRFRIRDEELLDLMQDENWDAEGIGLVLETEPDEHAAGPDSTDRPKLLTERLTLEDIKDIKEYGYYGGWKFEGVIPKSAADKIGQVDSRGNVVIRIVNGICIQAIQSSQRSGLIQGGTITILPSGTSVYGISPLTIVRYLQDVSDTQLILTVQALIESVYQNYVMSGDFGPDFARQLETRRPREVLVAQSGDIENLQPLAKDYTGLNIAVGALNLISQTMRNAMNARDPVQGIQKQTGEATATETQIVATSAITNVDQGAVLIERDELPRQGQIINDLYYINLDDEGKVFKRVGESETTTVNYFDIDAVSDINYVGARNALTKQQVNNQFRDFATVLSSNPITAAMTDWHALVQRWGEEGFELKGLDQLMLTDPMEIVSRMQAMGLARAAPSPGGAGGSGLDKGRSNPGRGPIGVVNPLQAGGEAG